MNKNILICLLATLLFVTPRSITAQNESCSPFTEFKIDVRGDFLYNNHNGESGIDNNTYGFAGKYFNLTLAGELGEKFTYKIRQRVISTPGSSSMFDNTDFLYIDYKPNSNWVFRFGKDCIFVGGFEFDATPIDEYFTSYYWDQYYCYQLTAAASFITNDGNHVFSFEVAQSPYVYSSIFSPDFGSEYNRSLMAYNFLWRGTVGHLNLLHSVNFFERQRGYYMTSIALGHMITYPRFTAYLDLMHRSLATNDWGKDYSIVARADYKVLPWLNIFAKGGIESNHSDYETTYANYIATGDFLDVLSRPESDFRYYGLGLEIRPTFCNDVRLHAYISQHHNSHPSLNTVGAKVKEYDIYGNIGLSWFIDVNRGIDKIAQRFARK